MTDQENDMRTMLEVCLRALNAAPSFTFSVGENPLNLKTNPRSHCANSYELAARVSDLLNAVK